MSQAPLGAVFQRAVVNFAFQFDQNLKINRLQGLIAAQVRDGFVFITTTSGD
jgi:hypothetical protein